jgi:hypothetical protein
MLKQPFSGVIQAPSPSARSRRASYFSASNSSLVSNELDIHRGDIFVEEADDDSVSSLESLTSGCNVRIPATPIKQLKASVNLPGSYCEKSQSPLKREPLTAKVSLKPRVNHATCYVKTPLSKPKRRSPSSKSKIPPSPASPKSLACHFSSSTAKSEFRSMENLPYALAVATPISATRVEVCCYNCDRKDTEIQKQAQEIEQLKGLVTQLVTVMWETLAQSEQPQHDSTPCDVPAAPAAQSEELSSELLEKPPQADEPQAPTSKLDPQLSSTEHWNEKDATSCLTEQLDMPAGTARTMLRLSRLKQLKQESSTTCKKRPHMNGKRHLHVSVAGDWGYFSGPPLEQNKCLHGCVIRFDNGDLYLGDMMCYVPSTSVFNDEHGLLFHGRGTLYRKDGTVTRGLFHKHQFKE